MDFHTDENSKQMPKLMKPILLFLAIGKHIWIVAETLVHNFANHRDILRGQLKVIIVRTTLEIKLNRPPTAICSNLLVAGKVY